MAQETGAFQRKREIRSSLDLLRLVLVYSLLDWSLRAIGGWATTLGLANLSDVAVLKRLRNALPWLGRIIGPFLERRNPSLPRYPVRLLLTDVTTVSRPGSRGTDWRIHVQWDLGLFSLTNVEITDAQGGESLRRHPTRPGEITVADQGYAHREGLGGILAALGFFVVRINWQNLPLETEDGRRFDVIAWLQKQTGFPCEAQVWAVSSFGRLPARLIAQALPPQEAEQARRRARRASEKKGHTPREETLFAAGFILLVTNLPAGIWTAEAILGLYRLRWQVELLFKRLKQILGLHRLRARDPVLAQVYLLGKILALLLLEDLSGELARGPLAEWFETSRQPVSPWRWMHLWAELLRQAVRGPLTFSRVRAALPRQRRYLCDAPRKRRQAAALIREVLLGAVSPEKVATGCQMLAYIRPLS